MSTRERRDIELFSLSILDCICCGFGAIILLFVLSKAAEPMLIEQVAGGSLERRWRTSRSSSSTSAARRRCSTASCCGKREQISDAKERIARLQGDLSALRGRVRRVVARTSAVQNRIEGRLAAGTAEADRGDAAPAGDAAAPAATTPSAASRSTASTSSSSSTPPAACSATRGRWSCSKMQETLEIYPKVKGIQVMNDLGEYMFPQYGGQWIPDTPAPAPGDPLRPLDLAAVEQQQPRGGDRRRDPDVLRRGQEDQPLHLRRRLQRDAGAAGRRRDRPHEPRRRGRATGACGSTRWASR